MCKAISLEEFSKLNLYKKSQNEVTSAIAYLIGVKEEYGTVTLYLTDDY